MCIEHCVTQRWSLLRDRHLDQVQLYVGKYQFLTGKVLVSFYLFSVKLTFQFTFHQLEYRQVSILNLKYTRKFSKADKPAR